MSNEVNVPKPKMTDLAKANFATQVAYDALVAEAGKLGLSFGALFEQVPPYFARSCRRVLGALTDIELPDESHG